MANVADLYAVLGVGEDATPEAIKKAFRQKAKLYHPDAHPGDRKAEEKFKELNQAWEILSDPEKRRRYDAMRRSPFGAGEQGGMPWGPGGHQGGFGGGYQGDLGSISDLFEMFFGGAGQAAGRARGGFGFEMPGADLESEVWVDFEDAALGRPVTVRVEDRPLRLNLPAAAEDGLKLRLPGQGGQGRRGRGDLYLTLRVRPSERFSREGLDLTVRQPLNLAQALLGATVKVATLRGAVRVKVPAGAQPGTRLRVPGQGLGAGGRKGDLFVELAPVLPNDLSAEEKAQVEALAKRRGWDL